MVRVFTKRKTTWTFTPNGAIKETKNSKTYFQEMRLGSKLGENFIASLEEKEWQELSTLVEEKEIEL